jgi:hypothetical protein
MMSATTCNAPAPIAAPVLQALAPVLMFKQNGMGQRGTLAALPLHFCAHNASISSQLALCRWHDIDK